MNFTSLVWDVLGFLALALILIVFINIGIKTYFREKTRHLRGLLKPDNENNSETDYGNRTTAKEKF
jgi:hypothetical protein